MKSLLKLCLSTLLAQILLTGSLQADETIFSNGFETCLGGELFTWDGGGDDLTWADQANWERDTLPADGDSILLEVFDEQSIVYDDTLAATTIRCLDSQRGLLVTGGDLEIIEAINIHHGIVITGGTFKVTGRLRVLNGL